MTKSPLLSIVIPCYNAEATIADTLDCFIAQFGQFEDYEIIVVDDGSKDNSVQVMQLYCSNNSRVKLHQKANGGVSSARNYGLKQATGTYVWFFDADDLLFDNALPQLINYLQEQKPDIMRFNSVTVNSQNKRTVDALNNSDEFNTLYQGAYSNYLMDKEVSWSCWLHIVNRELLVSNDLMFDETLSMHEDAAWGLTLAEKAPQALFICTNLCVVKYIMQGNSATNSINYAVKKKHLNSTISFCNSLNNKLLAYRGGVFRAIAKVLSHLHASPLRHKASL